jgi:hypothetical protein
MPINPLHYGWDVRVPPRPIFANGNVIGWNPPVVSNAGPHTDPNFPTVPNPPFGNPTGSSNIHFNGMVIGWGPGRTIVDPGPHGPGPPFQEPRPGPGESQSDFMLRCEAIMQGPPHNMASGAATTFCTGQWGMGPRLLGPVAGPPVVEPEPAAHASARNNQPGPPPERGSRWRGRK